MIDGPAQLIVYGKATVVREPLEVYTLHRERIRQIGVRHETDEELAERLRREDRVVLLLTPEKFYPLTMNRGLR